MSFQQVEQTTKCQLPIRGLRAAVGGGHTEPRGAMKKCGGRADLVDVLASGASRAREGFLEILGSNAERFHSLEQLAGAAHRNMEGEFELLQEICSDHRHGSLPNAPEKWRHTGYSRNLRSPHCGKSDRSRDDLLGKTGSGWRVAGISLSRWRDRRLQIPVGRIMPPSWDIFFIGFGRNNRIYRGFADSRR